MSASGVAPPKTKGPELTTCLTPRGGLGGLAVPDPVLGWRWKPRTYTEITVLGRKLVMEVDAAGCRPVTGQPQNAEKTLAAYGCSATYGWAIAPEETFCSLLQSTFPDLRVENHGVNGYSQTQNLLQLQRDSRWNPADFVTFCWIGQHLLRNVAAPWWVQRLNSAAVTNVSPFTMIPRAALDENGALCFRRTKLQRRDLLRVDLADFSPDPYYLDLVCFRLFKEASDIVAKSGGHFFVTTLLSHPSPQLSRMLAEAEIPVVDASVSGDEYTCLPDDAHPNALANRIYAERMAEYLRQRLTPN